MMKVRMQREPPAMNKYTAVIGQGLLRISHSQQVSARNMKTILHLCPSRLTYTHPVSTCFAMRCQVPVVPVHAGYSTQRTAHTHISVCFVGTLSTRRGISRATGVVGESNLLSEPTRFSAIPLASMFGCVAGLSMIGLAQEIGSGRYERIL